MKKLLLAGLLLGMIAGVSQARSRGYGSGDYGTGSNSNSTYVHPYERKDGTQVEGHWRTAPNSTESDNYGTKGNYNPYKGTYGTKSWDDNK